MICPCCQTDFPIEAGSNEVAARNAVKRAFSLPQLWDLLLAMCNYLNKTLTVVCTIGHGLRLTRSSPNFVKNSALPKPCFLDLTST